MKKSIMLLVLIALGLTIQSSFAMPVPGQGQVPDGGATALMLTMGLGGLVWCKNRFRR
jgi:hypothetical protein